MKVLLFKAWHKMAKVFLSLGSNKGDRAHYIAAMERRLKSVLLPPVKRSRLMKTEPVGVEGKQRWFYNRVICGGYRNSVRGLLSQCKEIETALGRTHKKKLASRTADVDILFFGNSIITEKDLVVPHPRIRKRRFCLEGLAELAPNYKVPGMRLTVSQLYSNMTSAVRRQKVAFMTTQAHSARGAK